MSRPGYSDLAMLKAWADQRESDSEFPRLIRRLILETNPGVVELGIPAGEGVATGGWDGIVESTETSAWVPKGRSLWELSTEKSVGVKADSDYEKRVHKPLVDGPAGHEYVAASLRPWTKHEEWAVEKRRDGVWKDVRAYGADKIETWLEDAPATWAWFSELNGLSPFGVRTASTWWEAWSSQTEPALPPDVLLAGREATTSSVVGQVASGGFVTTVGGPSLEEVCAFLTACAIAQDQRGSGDMVARTVFVDDVNAWRRLLDGTRPLILVPLDPKFASEVPRDSPHQVFVPIDRGDVADLSLDPLDALTVCDLLKSVGVDDGPADDYGRLARRSLTALRRRLGRRGLSNPSWSQHPVSRTARACLMAGGWVDEREGDQATLSELAGLEYEQFVEEAQGLSGAADPLVSRLDGMWHLVDALDSWSQLRSSVSPQDLERLISVMSTVLGEVDPALELPQDERWWRAAFDGRQRTCSGLLRTGLANTLALLGEFGGAIEAKNGTTGADLAAGVVRRLLSDANSDGSGQRWASLSDLLPLLAEAAPDAFLVGVGDGLSGDDPLLATVFADDGDPLFGSNSSHTGLLWALETVAWSPSHLGQVMELLAQLAEIDPGGRLSNRPSNSLVSIFRPWHPENPASDVSRLRIIDAVRCRHPGVSWTWLMNLLPESHGVHISSHSPKYRDWKPARVSVTQASYWEFMSDLIDRCCDDAASSTSRWLELIDKIDDVSPDDRAKIVSALRLRSQTECVFDEDELIQIWEKLRSLVAKHRNYSNADWSLSEEALEPLSQLVAELSPTKSRVLTRWLFDDNHADLDDIKWSEDHDAYGEALRRKRNEAVEQVLDEEGLEGVRLLASSLAQQAWSVGVALAEARPRFDDKLVEALDVDDDHDRTMEWAYFTRRFANAGWDWLEGYYMTHRELTPRQKARLLLTSNDPPAAWDRAAEFGDEVEGVYWSEFRQYGLGRGFEHTQFAAQKLLDAGRPTVALDLINLYSRKDQEQRPKVAPLVAECLESLLRQPPDESDMLRLASHSLDSLFALLEEQRETVGVDRVAQLEWACLPALGYQPTVPSLANSLAESPDRFVEVICAVYRPHRDEGEEGNDLPDEPNQQDSTDAGLAENAYRLLSNWRQPPGMGGDDINVEALNAWVDEAMTKLAEAGRLEAGLIHIGHVLSAFPPGENGVRPPQAVRDLIERLANRNIEEGFITQTLNNRGVTSRGLEDGGTQERDLVDRFQSDAAALADEHPRSAAILRRIADSYKREARSNEASAERFRRGLS
jgi:hypothetical protein